MNTNSTYITITSAYPSCSLSNQCSKKDGKEYYSPISLVGSLKDTRRRMTEFSKCHCTETIDGKSISEMYPIALCNSCKL